VKPEVATVSLTRGVFGVTGIRRHRDRTRAIKRWGIPQDVDAKRERALISRIPLNSNLNSLYLSLNTFSSRPFYSFSSKYSFMTKYRKFLSFFTTLDHSKIPFSLYKFNYLHRNLKRVHFNPTKTQFASIPWKTTILPPIVSIPGH
jgi:hypothetical protein